MISKIINLSDLQKFSTEDYLAVKQCAYEFLGKYTKSQFISYGRNVLGYKGDEPEYKLFASTVLFPIDEEFCELYNQSEKQLFRVWENFSKEKSEVDPESTLGKLYKKLPNCDLDVLELKAYEVDHFQLDLVLEQGILNIPKKKSDENVEKSL